MSGITAMNRFSDECKVIANEPMSRHTSWRAGGVARSYALPQTLSQLQQLMASLPAQENIEWLGLGSNTLVRDGGYPGTIVATQNVMNELRMLDEVTVLVGAGVADAKLARFCKQHGLGGAEFFAGIPGLVGGALFMNAGAWGGDTWSQVVSVETMNRAGEIKQRMREEFDVSYRHVGNINGEWFVSATMRFTPQGNDRTEAIDIKDLLARRARSQPTGLASCGSVF
ncbi:MAG TPA: FAD-binding protein, partial [Thiotrichales bacterium]|nr:FAD-binding protein [Thiotrichales bacterium]